jgi:hypothetical protein
MCAFTPGKMTGGTAVVDPVQAHTRGPTRELDRPDELRYHQQGIIQADQVVTGGR